MKGYFEQRGQAIKLDFDAATGQFVAKPIEHCFTPKVKQNMVSQKLAELRKRHKMKKAKLQMRKTLASMSPETREDVGMTEVYAATR